jgi:hypothetical protein
LKKYIKTILFLICITLSAMQKKRDILLKNNSHPGAHQATKLGLQVPFHWLADKASENPRQWAHQKITQKITSQSSRDIALLLCHATTNVIKDNFAEGLSAIVADTIWGEQIDETPSLILPFFEDVICLNHLSFGCEHFQAIYTEQRKLFEQKVETSQENKDTICSLGQLALVLGAHKATQQHRENIIQTGFEMGISTSLHYPLNYSINLTQKWILENTIINPINNLLNKKIIEHYEHQLVTKTAQICACHGCINEILENLPSDHPWREILIPIYERLLEEKTCCSRHTHHLTAKSS